MKVHKPWVHKETLFPELKEGLVRRSLGRRDSIEEFCKFSRAWLIEKGRCRKGDQLEDTVLAKTGTGSKVEHVG